MTKFIVSLLFASILFASSPSYAVDTALGGEVGFSRAFLRHAGETLYLSLPTPGISFKVGMDAKMNPDGTVSVPATWGFEFGTSTSADQSLNVSNVSVCMFDDWKNIRLIGGATVTFIEPDVDGEGLITELTNLVGVTGAIRFDANGLPAELGGSYSWRYDGVQDVELSEVHLGLVGSF